MIVERLQAILEASGFTVFQAQMAAADKATGGVKVQLEKLPVAAKAATEALQNVRMKSEQATQTAAVADSISRSLRGVSTSAGFASASMQTVRLDPGQAASTASAAGIISASLDNIGRSASSTRREIEGMTAAAVVGSVAGGAGGRGGGGLMTALGFGGLFGMGKFGSLAGLAGFGAERAITSTLGVAGSMVGGLAGGALLGLGAAGTGAVGMGTDLAGIGQAAGDIKNTTQALDSLQTAIQTYGKNSQQAARAQQQVNVTLQSFSPVARQAVLAASQTAQGFKDMFDTMTGDAEKTGAQIIRQAMLVGEKFLPTIGMFAAQNMGIIQKSLQPLFTWLQSSGSQGGLGIFTNLEQIFQDKLPTSVHAFSQALEVLFKVTDDAAQHIGGFINAVDRLFTKLNSPGMAGPMASEISKLIGLFETWLHLFGAVGGALVDLLRPAVGFGQQLAAGLTILLDKTRQWLSAAGTQDVLHAVFQAHLDQLKGLFAALEALGPALGAGIKAFLQIEAAISGALAVALKFVADVIKPIMSIPFAAQIAGWAAALLVTKKAVDGVIESGKILRVLLLGLGPAAAAGAAEADSSVASIGASADAATASVLTLNAALGAAVVAGAAAFAYYNFLSSHKPAAGGPAQGVVQPKKGGTIYAIGGGHVAGMNYPGAQEAAAKRLGVTLNGPPLPHGIGSTAATGAGNFGMAPVPPHVVASFAAAQRLANAGGGGAPFSVPGVPAVSAGGGGGGGASGVPAIGNAATTYAQLASHFATLAQTLNNTGTKAKTYLDAEKAALQKELAALPAATGKNASAIKSAAASIGDQLVKVNQLIKDALDKTGAALLPDNLKTKLASQTAQFNADSAYQQSLTGQTADDYRKILLGDLTSERTTLEKEINSLKSKLAGADQKQRANINAEITKLNGQLTSLNNSIISQIESSINALQSQLGSVFNSVQSELDQQLGNLFYQNGLLTPSEALLQSMQQTDQLNSLTQSLASAQQTLQSDQGTLAKHVLDVATGRQWDVFDPANAAKLAQDQQAVTAAQRALDEYNLQIKATQERTYYDNAYTTQVAKLNAQLATWEQNAMNGTATMGQLRDIAASFGLQINTQTVPDFDDLSTKTGELKQAFQDLIDYIKTLTGKDVTPPPVGNNNTGGTGGGYITPTTPVSGVNPGAGRGDVGSGIAGLGGGAGGVYVPPGSGDALSRYLANAGHPIAMASGGMGRVTKPTLFLAGEAGSEDFAFSGGGNRFSGGGGGDTVVNLHVSALDPASVDWAPIAEKVRKEFVRTARRNGNTTGNLLGTRS